MKTSLKKLQKFAALRHDKRPHKQHQPIALDELARATQDMNDMKDCYDSLLSAAAATANSVYEFSESLREMGDCLLEKTALNDDEESGKVLLMLGKAQFEIQKLVDGYRSHIFRTITVPSESLLNELRIVEEMKRRCDDKREIYEDMMKKQKEKGRLRGIKGEGFTTHQLQSAHDEYDEEANMFVFRMKSLKQGQSRSLLTQASRHHAAQLSFFKRSLKSLEGIEPHVRLVAEEQHIDYQFSELMDEDLENYEDGDETDSDDDDSEDGSETHDDGELSFEHGKNVQVLEALALKHSMELDDRAATVTPETKPAAAKVKADTLSLTGFLTVDTSPYLTEKHFPSPRRNSFSFSRDVRAISKSAPLFPDKKQLDSTNRLTPMMRSSPSRKFTSYVLPTPAETKGPVSGRLDKEVPQTRRAVSNLWHSSPLTPNKYETLHANDKLSEPIILNTQSVLKESNNTAKGSRLPSPLSEGLSFRRFDPNFASDAKKVKRQAFSGPIMGKTWTNPNNANFTASGPIASSGYPPRFSGSSLRAPLPQPTTPPKTSSGFTPIFVSSPKISELHELPRPPTHIAARKPANRGTHSGPLLAQRHDLATTARTSTAAASTLPMPPLVLSRSYSIPAGGPMDAVGLHVPLDSPRNTSSPPLTPNSLTNVQPASPTSFHR